MNPEANQKYDDTIMVELKKRLNRSPTVAETVNADTDSDLVNETIWQLVNDLYGRVEQLESDVNSMKKLKQS